MSKRAFPKIAAKQLPDGHWIPLTGREAETMIELQRRGSVGLRAYDFPGGPPFRLGAYVHDLRGFGFPIRTDREKHAGGVHAVYVLERPVAWVFGCPPASELGLCGSNPAAIDAVLCIRKEEPH